MGLPTINVVFTEKAQTAVVRSGRGVVGVVLHDATKETVLHTYKSLAEVKSEDFTAENMKIIKDVFREGPSTVHIVRLTAEQQFTDAEKTLDSLNLNWMCYVGETQDGVAEYVKARNEKNIPRNLKAVMYNVTADDKHIANFTNEKVTQKGENGKSDEEIEGKNYVARMAGMLAALPMTRTATYFVMNDLSAIQEKEDPGASIDSGELVLVNDYGTIRVGRGVNSLTTGDNEDLKDIAVVEAMDLIREDIMVTFKNYYCGQYKNNLDNQKLFIAAVNKYFRDLADEGILNNQVDNLASIDVDTQRKKWVESGKSEASEWSDEEVEKHPFGRFIFLKADISILQGLEDLQFNISMS